MSKVKKWVIKFFVALVLVSVFLPFTSLNSPQVNAVGESFAWNKTGAGHPEVRMTGGNFFIREGRGWRPDKLPNGSVLTFRPVPDAKVLNAGNPRLESDTFTVEDTDDWFDQDGYACKMRLVITLQKAGAGVRLDKGTLSVQMVTTDNANCAVGARDYNKMTASGFFRDFFGGSLTRAINITNAGAISPEYQKLLEKCKAEKDVEKCMNEGAAKIKLPGAADADKEATCVGGAIGYFLCPFSEAASGGMEALGALMQTLLKVQPLNINDPTKPAFAGDTSPAVYAIWNNMRNIANIVFIIMFMAIILSYVTSYGISNYGIKRTLPRLIIAAILVNVSYFICAFLIDLFNILGASIEGLFQNGINAALAAAGDTREGATGAQRGVVTGLAVLILVGVLKVAGPSILLLLLAPLISALLAIITLVAILIVRQFLITLLVIFSPLIAVAWLLPGTQKFFSKGVNAGVGALASYPIVMAVVMGSELIVAFMYARGIAPGLPGGGPNEWGTAVGVLLVQILVVVVVITTLKKGTQILSWISGRAGKFGGGGGILSKIPNKVGGWAGNRRANSGFTFRRKQSEAYRSARAQARFDRKQRRQLGRDGTVSGAPVVGAGWRARRRVENMAAFHNQAEERKHAEAERVAHRLRDDEAFRRQYAGSDDATRTSAALARGMQVAHSMEAEEIKAHKVVFENTAGFNLGQSAESASGTQLIAMLQMAREQGDSAAARTLLGRASEVDDGHTRASVVNELAQNHSAYRTLVPGSADAEVRQRIQAGNSLSEVSDSGVTDHLLEGTKRTLAAGKTSAQSLANLDGSGHRNLEQALQSMQGEVAGADMDAQRAILENTSDDRVSQLQSAVDAGSASDGDRQELERYRNAEKLTRFESALGAIPERANEALNNPQIKASAKTETLEALQRLRVRNQPQPEPEPEPAPEPPQPVGGQTPGGGPSGYL